MLSFLFVSLTTTVCQASGGDNLKKELVHGKWVNKSGGYIPNALGKSNTTVSRYKIYNFSADGSFTLDSI